MKKLFCILALACFVTVSQAQVKVRLKSDIGTYLCVCTGCVQTTNGNQGSFNAAMLHCNADEAWFNHFYMQQQPNGYYTFRTERGQYMGICSGCVRGTEQDFITFHTNSAEPWTQFEVKKLSNGKYAIRSVHNGKYVGRCSQCSPQASYGEQVAAHAGNPGPDWAQWDIEIY